MNNWFLVRLPRFDENEVSFVYSRRVYNTALRYNTKPDFKVRIVLRKCTYKIH